MYGLGFGNGMGSSRFGISLGLLLLWTFFWKGMALWKSAREENKYWFIALLLINTMGILEIAYLFFFAKEKLTLGSNITSSAKPKAKSKKK